MNEAEMMIIDFHAHCFPAAIAEKALETLSLSGNTKPYTEGTETDLLRSMDRSGVDHSVLLPVHTRPLQSEKLNRQLIRRLNEEGEGKFFLFGGMHPEYEGYRILLKEMAENGIRGIKLHPAFQKTDLDDIRMLRIIDTASELGMIVVVHAGEDISFPDHNYASISMLSKVIKEVEPPRLVAAHMGGWNAWNEVKTDLAGAPIWLDTAFSLGFAETRDSTPVKPQYRCENMNDIEFTELARAHGTDHILFGTDSPWAEQKSYVERISNLPMSKWEKEAILGKNAMALLSLQG